MYSLLAVLLTFSIVILSCSGHMDHETNEESRRWDPREYKNARKSRRGVEDSDDSGRRFDKEERPRSLRRRGNSDEDNRPDVYKRRRGSYVENSEEDEKKDRRRGKKGEQRRPCCRPENYDEDNDRYNKKDRRRGQRRPSRRPQNLEEDDEQKKGSKNSDSKGQDRRCECCENSDEEDVERRPYRPQYGSKDNDGEERRPTKRGQTTPRESLRKCPQWNNTFEESKCLWPGQNFFTSIPEICSPIERLNTLPRLVSEYYKSKTTEFIDVMANLLKQRGVTKPCGRCSLKLACRRRVSSSNSLSKNAFCKPVDVLFNIEDCDGSEPCQVSSMNGGCPAPIPKPPHIQLSHPLLRKVKHQISSLFAHQYGRDMSDDESEDQLRDAALEVDNSNNADSDDSAEFEETSRKDLSSTFPMWHCVKNLADERSCLCCCGDYFPDAKTRKCVKVKGGNIYPPINF